MATTSRYWASIVCVLFLCAACGGSPGTPTSPSIPAPPEATTAVLVGAGDIADCSNEGGRYAEATGKLLDAQSGTVFTAGDNVYPDGTAEQFLTCYDPRWGRHKWRTHAAAGNHDYQSPGAAPYFAYFGDAAGPSGVGYYSYALGAWHVIVLNSNITATNGSAQYAWLQSDLAANRTSCTAVVYHHPRFSSGPSGGGFMTDVWRLLNDQHVELAVSGHDHAYERFAPQDANARRDPASGVRQFVVGTGGAPSYAFVSPAPNSEVRINAYGVIRLSLAPQSYEWAFIEAGTGAILDSGLEACH